MKIKDKITKRINELQVMQEINSAIVDEDNYIHKIAKKLDNRFFTFFILFVIIIILIKVFK